MNLGFKGNQDRIIKYELENVSMPLGTSLIWGMQSLFGIKGEYQFGKTDYYHRIFSAALPNANFYGLLMREPCNRSIRELEIIKTISISGALFS